MIRADAPFFSTDPTQLGKDYRDIPAFIYTANGAPMSKLTHLAHWRKVTGRSDPTLHSCRPWLQLEYLRPTSEQAHQRKRPNQRKRGQANELGGAAQILGPFSQGVLLKGRMVNCGLNR